MRGLWPGALMAGVIAMAARFVSGHYGGPTMLYALLFGIAFNFLSEERRTAPGIEFSARSILHLGVALLGARITLADATALGWHTVALVSTGVLATIAAGWSIGRALGLKNDHAMLSASAVAICGASAALALSALLPAHKDRERNLILTVIGVTALSTLAMIVYPMLAHALAFDDRAAGIFLGVTIHDVAQVVGAGYMVSNLAGESATIVKLMRVCMLVPVVLAVSWLFRERRADAASGPALLPWFLVAYLVLVGLNSAGALSAAAADLMRDLSSWCIVAAVAALGMKTSLKDLVQVGPRPVAAMALQTAFLAGFAIAWLLFFGTA